MRKRKPKVVKFCGACCITLPVRRKRCDCGNENLGETTQPATLECSHCGDAAIESTSGLFGEDQGGACVTCGFPGIVRVDEDTAYWSIGDSEGAVCRRNDCLDCGVTWVPELRELGYLDLGGEG